MVLIVINNNNLYIYCKEMKKKIIYKKNVKNKNINKYLHIILFIMYVKLI